MSETNPIPPVPPGSPFNAPSALNAASAPYDGPAPDDQQKQMASLAHWLGIIFGFWAPLIIWLLKKDTMPFVKDQAKEALNFTITLLCVILPVVIVSTITAFIPIIRIFMPCVFGLAILGVVVYAIILMVKGGSAAKAGVAYRYPINLRLIK